MVERRWNGKGRRVNVYIEDKNIQVKERERGVEVRAETGRYSAYVSRGEGFLGERVSNVMMVAI
jgi:hypothetical protein